MSDDFSAASKFRSLSGSTRRVEQFILVVLTLISSAWAAELQVYFDLTFFKEQFLGFFFAFGMAGVFLRVKAHTREHGDRVPWYDWLGFLGCLITGGYILVMYPSIAYRLGILSPERWVLGGLAIVLVLEATRRVAGWALVWVGVTCILYAKFAEVFPGLLAAKGATWVRLMSYLYLDSNGLPLGHFLEDRLRLIGQIERLGFYGYHLAEHHSTPLGLAGSPSVFLASAFARTQRLRIGPLVYVLPLHHPLRLYEEICMLDHPSGGRLMMGVGRGGALIEHQRMGVEPKDAQGPPHN